MIQSITALLQNLFLNPLGIVALLSLIPLIIFYLTRPEPERRVMPSMEFFAEEEKESMLQNAIKFLKSNLILLINIFAVVLMTSAVAGLYLEGSGQESSVVIYDRSASMIEEYAEAISTVQNSPASEVTLIEVTETVDVHEGLNRQDAVDFVRDNPPGYYRSDMDSALQRAQQFDGELILLSNLDESEELVNEYRSEGSERGLRQVDYTTENRWGFVETGEDYVEIRNYQENQVTTGMTVNGERTEIELEPDSSNRFELNLTEGENTVELTRDDYGPDNTAYIYVPGDEALQVEYHGSENRHLDTAIRLIDALEMSEESGDLVILNEENSELYEDERPMILMQGSNAHWEANSSETVDVDFTEVNLGLESEVYNLNASENTMADPSRAMFIEDNRVYMNFEESEIRENIVYPVLWNKAINRVSEPPNFDNTNQNILYSDYDEPGFYETGAVNFLDSEQAQTNFNNIEQDIDSQGIEISQASLISLLVLLLLTGETLLILNRGVYQ